MALAVLLRHERFVLATDRAVLKRAEVEAFEEVIGLLQAATSQAQRIRRDAEASAQALARRVHRQAVRQAEQEVARAAAAAHVDAARILRRVEQAVVEIVVESVARLAAGIDHRRILEQSIREVAGRIHERTFAVLKVAPADLAATRQQLAELMASAALPATLSVRADAELNPGECVLLSDDGKLSIGLAQQLVAIAQAVHAALAESGGVTPAAETADA